MCLRFAERETRPTLWSPFPSNFVHFGTRGSVAGVAVLLARESTASEPLVASVRNVEPQVYLLLQNEAESRCSTTDQISRPWSKSKRPITSSLLAGIASYLPAIPRNSRRSWTGLRSDSKG